jgi:ubiquinone/menaquinone biosynthesis C-methylase UbiE
LVDDNLFNEHLSRYRFAARFLKEPAARILDAGCGSGYGSVQFGPEAQVIGIDVAHDAASHAREKFGRSGVSFLQASCDTIPFADASFDVVVAFEVIEHLERWRDLLLEARRVLKPAGVLLVSTPNKSYYAETRAAAGPNPFHVHEFEYDEFSRALSEVFPYTHLWSQNHAEAIAFTSAAHGGQLDTPPDKDPASAHFYFAACSCLPIATTDAFVWLPEAGNVLRERERHIALLEGEVRQKTEWLDRQTHEHARLKEEHDGVIAELDQRNQWAANLDAELGKARQIIADLQKEALRRLDWVHDLEGQIGRGNAEIENLGVELASTQLAFAQRTKWGEEKAEEARIGAEAAERAAADAERAAAEAARANRTINSLNELPYIRLGRKLGLIPDSPPDHQ